MLTAAAVEVADLSEKTAISQTMEYKVSGIVTPILNLLERLLKSQSNKMPIGGTKIEHMTKNQAVL